MHARPKGPVICLVAVMTLSCSTRLVGDIDENEANRIVRELEAHGIAGRKVAVSRGRDESWAVHVPEADAPAAREIIESLALPRPEAAGLAGLLEGSSIVPSPSQEKLRESVARGEQIASSLESLDGVVQASVIIATPDAGLGALSDGAQDRARSASVLVRHTEAPDVTEDQVRELVAGAVTGMDPDGVTVVFSRAEAPSLPERRWESLGPFVVAEGSRTPLAVIMGVMALMNLTLGAWVVVAATRSRRPGRRDRALQGGDRPEPD